jgi:hypothetical protein
MNMAHGEGNFSPEDTIGPEHEMPKNKQESLSAIEGEFQKLYGDIKDVELIKGSAQDYTPQQLIDVITKIRTKVKKLILEDGLAMKDVLDEELATVTNARGTKLAGLRARVRVLLTEELGGK